MELHRSARRHGIDPADIEHVVAHPLAVPNEENDEGINQILYLGGTALATPCSKSWFSISTTAGTWPSTR